MGDPIFARVQNAVAADLTIACDAAMQTAQQLGYNALLRASFVQGEARAINASGCPVAQPACVVCGGETTVTPCGKGKGGRNQKIALAAAIGMDARAFLANNDSDNFF
jgi:glycerate-2-kinase